MGRTTLRSPCSRSFGCGEAGLGFDVPARRGAEVVDGGGWVVV